MAAGDIGASWFETREDALLTMRDEDLLRRDLPWRRRRIDQVGGQLLVARFGIRNRLLLHRAVAADAVGQ